MTDDLPTDALPLPAAAPPAANPYVGPRAFQAGERLFGRDRELRKLTNLLIAERILLLYGPSGAGKTSLIQAALIPALERERFRVYPVIRAGAPLPGAAQANRFLAATLAALDPGHPPGITLEQALVPVTRTRSEADSDVLIFDQFEEVLTTDPTAHAEREQFFTELGEALRDRQRWALFSMREDYIASLDPYVRAIPTRLSARFRLDLLGVPEAMQAMQLPARHAGVEFSDDAARKLADDLRRVRVQYADGTVGEEPGLVIEPVQLQVVCYRLWERLNPDHRVIAVSDLATVGTVDQALAAYYADQVRAIAAHSGVRERTIREWFERQLITEAGLRGQVMAAPDSSAGLANTVITDLVQAHLVRVEQRRGATWYELAHDRMVGPLRADNAAWLRANLSLVQLQAERWLAAGRSPRLLLGGNQLREARRWAAAQDDQLTPEERVFLEECQQAEDLERRTTQVRRTRLVALLSTATTAVVLVLLLVAVGVFFQARAAASEASARAAEAATARARAQAEAQLARTAEADARAEAGRAGLAEVRASSYLLALGAASQLAEWPQRSLLLAVEALSVAEQGGVPPLVAEQELRAALQRIGGQPLSGHENDVRRLAWSPDGRWIATAADDGRIRLWDAASPGQLPELLALPGQDPQALAFSPDGAWLAAGSLAADNGTAPNTAYLWRMVAPGDPPLALGGFTGNIFALAFSPDSSLLAVAGTDRVIRIWRTSDLQAPPRELAGHAGEVYALGFNASGMLLASGGSDETVRLWPLDQPGTAPVVRQTSEPVVALAFAPAGDPDRLALVTGAGLVQVLDVQAFDPLLYESAGTQVGASALDWSPDGCRLARGGQQALVLEFCRLAAGAGPLESWLGAPAARVQVVRFSPDGRALASGSDDGTVRVWATSRLDGGDPLVLRGLEAPVVALTFSPDSTQLAAAGGQAGRVWTLDQPTRDPRLVVPGDDEVLGLATTRDPAVLALSTRTGRVQLWNLAKGVMVELPGPRVDLLAAGGTRLAGLHANALVLWDLAAPEAPPGRVVAPGGEWLQTLALTPDGRWMASSSDERVLLWDLDAPGGTPFVLEGRAGEVSAVALEPAGQAVAATTRDGAVLLWSFDRLEAGPEVLVQTGARMGAIAFSPDGRSLVASGSTAAQAFIWRWDMASRATAPRVFAGVTGRATRLVFSPDGQRLGGVLFGEQQPALWDTATPETAPVRLPGPVAAVRALAVSPDGRVVYGGTAAGQVWAWTLPRAELRTLACTVAGRNLTAEEWRRYAASTGAYRRTCENVSQ